MNKDRKSMLAKKLSKLYDVMYHNNISVCKIIDVRDTHCVWPHHDFLVYRTHVRHVHLEMMHTLGGYDSIENIKYNHIDKKIDDFKITFLKPREIDDFCLFSHTSTVDFGDLINKIDLKVVELI